MFLRYAVFLSVILFSAVLQAEKPWTNTASVHWSEIPLGEALSRFAAVQKIGILLDRRIDPSQPLNFEASHQTLEEILRRLAASADWGCCFTGSTVYLGPKTTAAVLPVLFAENRTDIQKTPARQSTVFRRNVSLEIPFLGEPKKILQELADKNKLRWANLEVLPYDVWDKKELLHLPLDELLTILLAGFDMSFQIEKDGQTLTLVPISERKLPPQSDVPEIKPVKQTQKETAPPVPLAQRRFTLNVEQQPIGVLLKMLTQRLSLTLEIDEDSLAAKGVTADTRVSFEVKNATAQELFRAVLKPLRLEFRIKGNTVTVR